MKSLPLCILAHTDNAYEIFAKVCSQVRDILPFGAPNWLHQSNDRNIIAHNFYYETYKVYENFYARHAVIESLTSSYICGTGTCEIFALMTAILLSKEYDFTCEIETICSLQRHTYLKIRSSPPFVFDAWSGFACEHSNDNEWNENISRVYIRSPSAHVTTNLVLCSEELRLLADEIFTIKNSALRETFIKRVDSQENKCQMYQKKPTC